MSLPREDIRNMRETAYELIHRLSRSASSSRWGQLAPEDPMANNRMWNEVNNLGYQAQHLRYLLGLVLQQTTDTASPYARMDNVWVNREDVEAAVEEQDTTTIPREEAEMATELMQCRTQVWGIENRIKEIHEELSRKQTFGHVFTYLEAALIHASRLRCSLGFLIACATGDYDPDIVEEVPDQSPDFEFQADL